MNYHKSFVFIHTAQKPSSVFLSLSLSASALGLTGILCKIPKYVLSSSPRFLYIVKIVAYDFLNVKMITLVFSTLSGCFCMNFLFFSYNIPNSPGSKSCICQLQIFLKTKRNFVLWFFFFFLLYWYVF